MYALYKAWDGNVEKWTMDCAFTEFAIRKRNNPLNNFR